MKSNKLLKKQKIRFLAYNMLAFAAIFTVLGVVAVSVIEGFFYRGADRELTLSRNFVTERLSGQPEERPKSEAEPDASFKKNPRLSYIIYGSDSAVITADTPDFLDYGDLQAPGGRERFYNAVIEGYNYRVLDFTFEDGGSVYYARILLNIDGETALRNNIIYIYFICLSVIVILAAAASYLMSAVTMRPVKKAMEAQTLFVSDASHELKTPLTVLHSRLEHLLSFPDRKIMDKSEEISDCLSEVMRLTKLSNNLLALAKSDADKILPDISEFDIYGLVKKVAAPYTETANCCNKEFTVSGQSLTVRADEKKIMQVLIILFDNALKYTGKGDRIDVRVAALKNKAEITVADTGAGISEAGLSKVFERFYRDDVSRGATEGSGLGLSIAKQIIEEHKGSVSVAHNRPKGAVFTVVI